MSHRFMALCSRLAVVMFGVLAFSAVRAEASTFDKVYFFDNTTFVGMCVFGSCQGIPGANNAIEIHVDNVDSSFDLLGVTAMTITQADFEKEFGASGFNCLGIIAAGCLEYNASPNEAGPFHATITIAWTRDTASITTSPNIFHSGAFGTEMLGNPHFYLGGVPGIPFCDSECEIDDGDSGTTDNFGSHFAVAYSPAVPEPGTLFLVGSGVAGLIYRRRRRSIADNATSADL